MDWLVLRAFFKSVQEQAEPPIDVYDTVAWMCISTLSEQSVAMGGHRCRFRILPAESGIKEIARKQVEAYRLDVIPEENIGL